MANTKKGKSGRRPLTDISNASRSSKTFKKNTSDESHDRLLRKLSDLSKVIHQLDDLVISACKLKLMSKLGNHEIKSFTHVLSDIESHLQPWFPRFQQLFSNQSNESGNGLTELLPTEAVSDTKDKREVVVHGLKESELSPLVSPSPLVSWHASCEIESGRQLFLLTPLPRSKVLSSKRLGSSRFLLKDSTNKHGIQKSLNVPKASQYPSSERGRKEVKLNKTPEPFAMETENRLECQIFSPEKFCGNQKGRHATYLMTPCLKMSPPKTCMLLEPLSEIRCKKNNGIPDPTTLAAKFLQFHEKSQIPENSSSIVSNSLGSKHPEFFGLQMPNKSVMRREIEESLHWFLSPPKTCSVMETPMGKLSTNPTINDPSGSGCILGKQEKECSFSDREKEQLTGRHQSVDRSSDHEIFRDFDLPGRTPMWRKSRNTVLDGKKPGECTLKRELWAKFEAASENVIPFNVSILEEVTGKGFLDRLEEVSHEEMGSDSMNLEL